jgi:hypothetical protein
MRNVDCLGDENVNLVDFSSLLPRSFCRVTEQVYFISLLVWQNIVRSYLHVLTCTYLYVLLNMYTAPYKKRCLLQYMFNILTYPCQFKEN